MRSKRFAVLGALLALALTPAVAVAESGSDQYCDPFGGCGGNTDTGGASKGGSKGRGLSPKQTAQIEQILNSMNSTQRERAAAIARAASGSGAGVAAQMRSSHARLVLEAAGLSALGSTIPAS